MKKHIPTMIFIFVFVIGLGVLLYPVISDFINKRSQSGAIIAYTENVSSLSQDEQMDILKAAQVYNERLWTKGNFLSTTEEGTQAYHDTLRVNGSDMMGSIEIPSIDVKLPIYHTTSSAVLQSGVGHLAGSTMPVGGTSTHAVLTGHRGLPSAELFTNLDRLEIGETFSIHVLSMQLTYQVDQIDVVNPEEVERIQLEQGKDYVTLVTCTPYGVNTHRLLVRGKRIPNPAVETASQPGVAQEGAEGLPSWVILIAIGVVTVLVCGFVIILARLRRRHVPASGLKYARPARYGAEQKEKGVRWL